MSAINAAELLVFAALDEAITGAGVYQHAPDNAPCPLVIVGDIEATPLGAKDDPDRRIDLTVIVITEGQERKPCTDLCDAAQAAIDGVTLTGSGHSVTLYLQAAVIVLAPDGENYVGTLKFIGPALSD